MYRLVAPLVLVFFTMACVDRPRDISFTEEIDAIKREFAPDGRVALFDISAVPQNGNIVLKGESNLPHALDALKGKLVELNANVIDSVQILPSTALQGKTQAVINVSVANLRSNPKHSAELATQATLGTPVSVLKKEGGWYYIQTPDKYLSWVDDGGIALMDAKRFEEWKTGDKIMYTKTYGHAYVDDGEDELVSDLVAGDVLEFVSRAKHHFVVRYPDGRRAMVRSEEAENYSEWLKTMNATPDRLVASSKNLMGVPYLWGGTSTKGVDCSGFTKTVYFLNGMVIPRDASQQVHTGRQIDENGNFKDLEKGDLLFFGRKATDSTDERVVHVGMWIGNDEFIHASNRVRVSSVNKDAPNFDAYNLNRYLRTKRILKEEDNDLIRLTETPVFE